MFTINTRPLAKGNEELTHRGLKAEMLLNYQPDPTIGRDAEIMRLSRKGKSAVKIVSHLQKDYPDMSLGEVYGVLHELTV